MGDQKVWFVTGASRGLGLTMVKQLLNKGYKVAATSRHKEELTKAVDAESNDFLPLTADLGSEQSVAQAIEQTVRHFGSIDMVVNNAGYGLIGALEELTDKEVKDNFDINVFGSLNVIRKALPYLREQGSGHIFNISSIGGFTGAYPGWGIYCATKFAVMGFSESLAEEVRSFGIHVTVVAPGYFRTDFLSTHSIGIPKHAIDAYEEVRASQDAHQNTINGSQPGDPEKAVAAIIATAQAAQPPVHLFLGQDAYDSADKRMDTIKDEMEVHKSMATSTSF